jgi:hypothetical protein
MVSTLPDVFSVCSGGGTELIVTMVETAVTPGMYATSKKEAKVAGLVGFSSELDKVRD